VRRLTSERHQEEDEMVIEMYLGYRCNLACQHCYVGKSLRRSHARMPIDKAVGFVKEIAAHAGVTGSRSVDIQLMGGEPTLVGDAYLETLADAAREAFGLEGVPLSLAISTNLLTDVEASTLGRFDQVRTAFDGTVRFQTEAKRHAWESRVAAMHAAGIELDVQVTITKPLIAEWAPTALYEYLVDTLGVRQISLIYAMPVGDATPSVGQNLIPAFTDTSAYMIAFGEVHLARRNPNVTLAPIDPILEAFSADRPRSITCCASGVDGGAIAVGPDGSVTVCPSSGWKDDPNAGNVFEDGFARVFSSRDYRVCISKLGQRPRECYTCDFFAVCRGGCQRMLEERRDQVECHGFKAVYEWAREKTAGYAAA
jgi:uncharacterized protein